MELFIIGVVLVVMVYVLATSGKKETVKKKLNPMKTPEQVITESLQSVLKAVPNNDESVIDVTGNSYKIPQSIKGQPVTAVVPWPHFYVYNADDLQRANRDQQVFYSYFRKCFIKGEFLPLSGYDNYAFILLFDLVKDFYSHKNITIIEGQLWNLADNYPRTKDYSLGQLRRILIDEDCEEGLDRLEIKGGYPRLGTFYRQSLSLSAEMKHILNEIYTPSNNFMDIPRCKTETVKLFVTAWNKLEELYASSGGLIKQVNNLAGTIAKKVNHCKEGSENYKYNVESSTKYILLLMFRMAENVVRDNYGHKRKVDADLPYSNTVVLDEMKAKLAEPFIIILSDLADTIEIPDKATELLLNEYNTTRWKAEFEKLKQGYTSGGTSFFVDRLNELTAINTRNSAVEMIYFEAAKFIAKHDKEAAVQLYVRYVHADLQSKSFDNRQLTKTLLKNLFKTPEQLKDFEAIVAEMITGKALDESLKEAGQIFKPKRKKIKLDAALISEVREEHAETVEVLSELLKDEEQDMLVLPEIKIGQPKPEGIELSEVHFTTLAMFVKNNYVMSQADVAEFARAQGLFTNQLIENINEVCYEKIDDVLIEEEDDQFVINSVYYQKLFAQ